jgi:cysteine-rich repeat protein
VRWKFWTAVLLTCCLWSRGAEAIPACSAADIIAQEGTSCPASGACTITKVYDVSAGQSCTFDFGSRSVTISNSGRLNLRQAQVRLIAGNLVLNAAATTAIDMRSGTLEITAGSVTINSGTAATVDMLSGTLTIDTGTLIMANGAVIDARGNAAAGATADGGIIEIQARGAVTLNGTTNNRSRIDVSANSSAGRISISAGGRITLNGRLLADRISGFRTGKGGQIYIASSAGDVVAEATAQSEITAIGGDQSEGGGSIEIEAAGNITLSSNTVIDVGGSNGGTVDLTAEGDITFPGVRGNGTGESGNGGSVDVQAGGAIQQTGNILLRGGTLDPSSGGSGGTVSMESLFGDIVLLNSVNIYAEGSAPDGDGGEITLSSAGSLDLRQGATISASSNGSSGSGGQIDLRVALNISGASQSVNAIDASGGAGGGSISIEAGGHITLGGTVDAQGRAAEGAGGEITIAAGSEGSGDLTIQREVNVTGGLCSADACGDGGSTDLSGCNVRIQGPNGAVRASAPGSGGQNRLSARRQLTIDSNATVTAATSRAQGSHGTNLLEHPIAFPVIGGNRVLPGFMANPRPACSPTLLEDCLTPCPQCGNGVVEFPEECDGGNAVNCDGCTSFCAIESCSPVEACPGGVNCHPTLGCIACPELPAPTPTAGAPESPTATVTAVPTSAATPTASPSPTPLPMASFTHSAAPTPTATASALPTLTATTSPSATSTNMTTATPTSSATLTSPSPPTQTPTPSQTPVLPSATPSTTASASATSTLTPTATDTVTPTLTPTQMSSPSSCPGDCGGDKEVTVDELLTMVNIALGTNPVGNCPAGDTNGDGEVTIDEILMAVNAALLGCA